MSAATLVSKHELINQDANPAERELIGILLNRQDGIGDCEILVRDDFQEARHYAAFAAIKALHAAGDPIDPLAVATALDAEQHRDYEYLALLAKDYGFYTGNTWARAVSIRKVAINRACHLAAADATGRASLN